jgi:YfiH family protein
LQFEVENSPFGRVVVAADAPLFYTTVDFRGRIDDAIAAQISLFVGERFGIDARLVTCHQIHSAAVEVVAVDLRPGRPPSEIWRECDACDALVSTTAGTALGIKVADCLPVTIVSDGAIANIHSGWRGAVQNITAATLDRIETTAGSAYLGPSIRVCCFEVGEEVASQFPERFVDRSHAKPHVDIPAFTADILRSRGFAPDRIHDSSLCTRCPGSMFHSYRRDGGGGGRNLAIVAH